MLYEYVIGDFSFLASTHTIDNDFGVAVTYNLGGVGLGLGYAYNDGTDESSLTLDVGLDFGAWLFGQQEEPIGPNQSEVGGGGIPLSTNLILSDNDVWGLAYGIDFVAGVGPATDLTFVYGGSDTASEDSYGIGVEYDLGGGAALAGGIGEVDGDVVADFGITMSF